jgi:hypothetical protein
MRADLKLTVMLLVIPGLTARDGLAQFKSDPTRTTLDVPRQAVVTGDDTVHTDWPARLAHPSNEGQFEVLVRKEPALGYFQMEPKTHDDCWTNSLDFRASLKAKVLAIRTAAGAPKATETETDPKYAAVMARVRYMRVPASILTNPRDIAAYWKLHYNTPLGAGSVSEFFASWNTVLTPQPYAPIS